MSLAENIGAWESRLGTLQSSLKDNTEAAGIMAELQSALAEWKDTSKSQEERLAELEEKLQTSREIIDKGWRLM